MGVPCLRSTGSLSIELIFRQVLVFLFLMLCGASFADETYLVRADKLDYVDIEDDECPIHNVCIFNGWFRYRITGWSIESGAVIDRTVAYMAHTWLITHSPWLVALKTTEGKAEYDFLGVEYIISDIEVFNPFVCTSNPVFAKVNEPDIALLKGSSDIRENPNPDEREKCFTYLGLQEKFQSRDSKEE